LRDNKAVESVLDALNGFKAVTVTNILSTGLAPRLTAGIVAVYLIRDALRLLGGRVTWVTGRSGIPVRVSRVSAQFLAALFILLAIGLAAFALLWRGSIEFPRAGV
jgi:hypothetical protein